MANYYWHPIRNLKEQLKAIKLIDRQWTITDKFAAFCTNQSPRDVFGAFKQAQRFWSIRTTAVRTSYGSRWATIVPYRLLQTSSEGG